MPQVPYASVPDVSPQDVPAPQARISTPPAAFGANVAEAIQHLGGTEEHVGDELFSRAVAMQQLRNETEANTANANYLTGVGQKLASFRSLQGQNATDGYNPFVQDITSLRQSTRDGLSNDAARRLFDNESRSTQARTTIQAADYAAGENRKSWNNSKNAQIDAETDAAGYARNDAEFKDHLSHIDALTHDFSIGMGLDRDSANQLSFKNQSRALANRIDQTANTDPVKARKMLDEALADGELHSQDRDRVEAKVHAHLMVTGTRYFTNQNDLDFRDPETFLAKRGLSPNVRATGVDPTFGQNMVSAITKYEAETGTKAKIDSLVRTTEEQARIRAEHEAMPGGVEAHPAALPGTSRHEFGQAADVDPAFSAWLKQIDSAGKTNAEKFGLEFLPGRTGVNDPNHVQLAGGAPLRRVKTYDIDEKAYVNGAVNRAVAAFPDAPPEFLDRVDSEARNKYRNDVQYDRQQEVNNFSTVLDVLSGEKAPQTLSDLLKDPTAAKAYFALDPKSQEQIRRHVDKDPVTDPNEFFRLKGMANDPEQVGRFLDEDVVNNPKLSKRDKRAMFDLQATRRRQGSVDANISWAMGQVRAQIPEDDLKDRDLMNQFRGALQSQMELYEQVHKTPLKGPELQETAQRLLAEYTRGPELTPYPYKLHDIRNVPTAIGNIPAWFKRTRGPLYQTPIPSADYDRLKNEFTKSKGYAPTDPMIQQLYIGELYQKLYGR